MKKMMTMFLCLGLVTHAGAQAPGLDLARVKRSLNDAGFVVQEGAFRFFDVESCRDLPNCAGNNPASPYGMYWLPPGPGEVRPPCDGDATLCPRYRLRSDEAIILIGQTPPECKYFSVRSYLFSRQEASGSRKTLFASLGDALNNLKIATTGTPLGSTGVPFAKQTVVVTTADRGMDRAVRGALMVAGLPARIMNTDVLPSRLPLRMGLAGSADDFSHLFRVAGFARPKDQEAYVSRPPLTLLRVTPIRSRPADPYPTTAYAPRGTGTSETAMLPGLPVALTSLASKVKQSYPTLSCRVTPGIKLPLFNGFECIEKGYNCLGDVQDTTYVAGAPGAKLSRDPRDFIIVVGVNHHSLGKATYQGLSIYDLKKLLGTGGVTEGKLYGTARRYDPSNPYAADLYAYKFARNCNGDPDCVTVPEQFPGVPLDNPIEITERAYLEPQTRVGPAYSEVTAPVFLHFRPPSR